MEGGQTVGKSRGTGGSTDDIHGRLSEFVRGMVTRSISWFLESEDFIQEAWVTALENGHLFQGESDDDFVSWLCGIARNKYRNARRMYPVLHRQWTQGEGPGSSEMVEAREPRPDAQVAREEVCRLLSSAMNEVLTDFEATLVDLVILEGCKVTEIASRCHVSRRRIDRGLSRALGKLAQHLERLAPEVRSLL